MNGSDAEWREFMVLLFEYLLIHYYENWDNFPPILETEKFWKICMQRVRVLGSIRKTSYDLKGYTARVTVMHCTPGTCNKRACFLLVNKRALHVSCHKNLILRGSNFRFGIYSKVWIPDKMNIKKPLHLSKSAAITTKMRTLWLILFYNQ